MAAFDKMTVWDLERRLGVLVEFRNLLVEYYNNVEYVSCLQTQPNNAGIRARMRINAILDDVRESMAIAGFNPTIDYSDPPAVGGRQRFISLLDNLFNLSRFSIPPEILIDVAEQAIGKYERNRNRAVMRTINPFFWLNQLLASIFGFPFRLLASAGLVDESTLDSNDTLRIVKAIVVFIGTSATYTVSFITIAEKLGYLDALKNLINQVF